MKREQTIYRLVRSYADDSFRGIMSFERKEAYIKGIFDNESWRGILDQLESYEGVLSTDSKILDLGCGLGSFLNICQKKYYCVGIDPDMSALKIANLRGVEVIRGVGESLPFKEGCFDAVVSHSMIEHVQSPKHVVNEAWRALKDGGIFFVSGPNYLSFWEPHYKILWFPKFPKPIAKLYLKLRKRDPSYIQSINYITINKVLKICKSFVFLPNYRFHALLRSPEKTHSKSYRCILYLLKKFKLLSLLQATMMKIGPLRLYYTLGIINPFKFSFSITVAKRYFMKETATSEDLEPFKL